MNIKKVESGTEIQSVSAKVIQYSNHDDVHGEKLFDGDIVSCFNVGFSVVKFKNSSWGSETNGEFKPFIEIYGHCRKIGNIYDHTLLN